MLIHYEKVVLGKIQRGIKTAGRRTLKGVNNDVLRKERLQIAGMTGKRELRG